MRPYPIDIFFDRFSRKLYVMLVDCTLKFSAEAFDPDAPFVHTHTFWRIGEGESFNIIGVTTHSFKNVPELTTTPRTSLEERTASVRLGRLPVD